MNLVPEWTGLVVSSPGEIGHLHKEGIQLADFRNALLYCDKGFWCPSEYISARVSKIVADLVFERERQWQASLEGLKSSIGQLLALKKRLNRLADLAVVVELSDLVEHVQQLPLQLKEEFVKLENSAAAVDSMLSSLLMDLNDAGLTSSYRLLLPERSFFDQLVANVLKNEVNVFSMEMPDPDLVIAPSSSTEQQPWATSLGVTQLSLAMSRLYLPDVGQMPFEAIAEMKDSLNNYLNPMRAELLRLSEDLRKMVHNAGDVSEVQYEAEILIRVRVEPLIREVGQKAEEMMKKKWRRFFQGVAKVFGLTGAAFFKPDLLKDALKEALDTGAAMVEREDYKEPVADTAHFVLEARRFLIERRADVQ